MVKNNQYKSGEKWKKISLIMFIITFYAPVLGVGVAGVIAEARGEYYIMSKYMWVEFWLLPIPIASIAVGRKMKKMGIRRRRNTIIGIIMCIVICIFGSFSFALSEINESIKFAKEEMKIDISKALASNATSNRSTRDSEIFKDCSSVSYLFSEADTQKFKARFDERWVMDISDEFTEIFPDEPKEFSAEYALFYNITTGEYNVIPKTAGEYEVILLLISDAENNFYILRYTYIISEA